MEDEIRQNLVFLMENLTSLTLVLAYLEQCKIISKAESDEIKGPNTPQEKNYRLLSTLQKKNWQEIRNLFLEILKKTKNDPCAQKIIKTNDGHSIDQDVDQETKTTLYHSKINKKWWPEKKLLIQSLLKRKLNNKLFNEELHDRLSKDANRMLVICESSAATKYSGMGGVGKTLTAKWYAHSYHQEYDHIIWIDCGEGGLLTSFKKLASDLEIPNRNELVEIQDYSRKCFDALSAFQCLWIYDNAENYKGEEGIINVLPKDEKNFYCIITSRSREWGTETGFGKISDLEIDIFSEEESLEFFKRNLNTSVKHTESQLKELCRLMGNLPLALQLAVAALNNKKVELQSYIEKTLSKDLGFLDEKFDDYERTINNNIKISLDLIIKEKNGKLAYKMLMIFGYIRPDEIRSKFLMKVLNINPRKIEQAVDLLEKYSLITKSGKIMEFPFDDGFVNKLLRKNEINLEMDLLSIHRLLQQVLRYNGRETEKKTLKKILGCVGFIDYKLIPFTKYADDELRKAFPKVRAELLDQEELKKLISGGRMEESVELARFIHRELKTKTSKFNFAICLEKNEQLEECSNILKELENEEMKEMRNYSEEAVEIGMLGLTEELSRDLIWGHLLIIYSKMNNRKDIKQLLESRRRFQVIYSEDSLDTLIRLIHSDLIKSSYSLVKDSLSSTIALELGGETSRIVLMGCSLDLSSFDRLSPEELELRNISFNRNGWEVEEVANLNEFCDFHKINKLTFEGEKLSIELSDEISMEYLCLWGVKVLDWKVARWNVQRLELEYIPFVEKTKVKVKEMEFYSSSLEISCLPPTIQKLYLYGAEVYCNELIDLPNLKYLTLELMSDSSFFSSFRSANLTHIHFFMMKEVNVDQLPKSVTHVQITLEYPVYTTVVSGVRRMDKLILVGFRFKEMEELLGHFQTDELVVDSAGYSFPLTPKELIELTKKEIKRIAVGRIDWKEEDLSVLSSHVDRKADYYLWEGGRGRGMEWGEFWEIMKLY